MEELPTVWRVAASILNIISRTANKWWSSGVGIWRGANSSSQKKTGFVTKWKYVPRAWTDPFQAQLDI